MRAFKKLLSGLFLLAASHYTWGGDCDDVFDKALQGTRSGTYFNQTNQAKIREVPSGEYFDFEVTTSLRNGGCPGIGGPTCLISGEKGSLAREVDIKSASSGSPSVTVNSGQTLYLGSRWLSGYSSQEYSSITVNSGGTVYFHGGLSVSTNSNGGMEYIVDSLTINSGGQVYMPPGDFYFGSLNVDGELLPMGDDIPWWWFRNFSSDTSRIYVEDGFRVQNSGAGINPNSSSPIENMVIFTNGDVDLLGGTVRGALIQDNRSGSSVNFNMSNNGTTFEGVASVDYGFNMSGGDFYYDGDARNAEFADICEAEIEEPTVVEISTDVATALTCEPIDITVEITQGDERVTDYTGAITLSSTSTTGLWSDDGSLRGSLGSTTSGTASYQFDEDDSGIIVLKYQNPDSGTATLTASIDGDSAEDSTSEIEFSPNGYLLTFQADYATANRSFQLEIEAVEQDESDPFSCQVNQNYAGNKDLLVSISYGDINGEPSSGDYELTHDGLAIPSPITLEFENGKSDDLDNLNYQDVGPITISVQEQSAEFPEYGLLVSEDETITVIPDDIAIIDIRDWSQGSCGIANPSGTESSGSGFTSAGSEFGILIAGLMDNCSVPDSITGCNPSPSGVESCITPSFREAIELTADQYTPDQGILGAFGSDEVGVSLEAEDFVDGYSLETDYQYSEVGSFTLTATMDSFLGYGATLSDSVVIGRFYPDYFILSDDSESQAACVVGDFSYMGQQEQGLEYEVIAYNVSGEITQNYDNQTYGYVNAADAPYYFLYNTSTNLTDRFLISDTSLAWTQGVATFDGEFSVTRSSAPDGPYLAAELGLSLSGGDGETFLDDDMSYLCDAVSCDAVPLLDAPLAPLYYGRLVTSNGYSPQGQSLHVPLELEYWNGSQFTTNSDDSCSAFNLDMMSFSPDLDSSDQIEISGGDSSVQLTNDLSSYGDSVTANSGRFWLSFSSPGTSGAATYFMGTGGESVPAQEWPDWLKYDWDQDGSDDEAVSGIVSFGSQRGSDRIISKREI